MKIDSFLYELRLLDNAEESILRKMDDDGPKVEKELRDELRELGLKKVALCHQFGLQYPCQYGKVGGLVEVEDDHASRVIQCNLDQMIEEIELEKRMKIIAQNGNSGLHYSDDVGNDHN